MIAFLALLGLFVGVLINLLADSLPTVRRVARPTCAECGRPRPLPAWSGLLAFLTGQSRCAGCGRRLSFRHPLVEVGTAVAFALIGLGGAPALTLIANLLYAAVFILVLVTDLEHRLILHAVMLPAIGLALIAAFVDPFFKRPALGLLGGAVGLAIALLLYWFGILFTKALSRARGRPINEVAFGFGDVTLITFIGLVVGLPGIILALVIGILCGGVGSLLYLVVVGLIRRRYSAFTAIPYGPFLILGGVLMRYWGPAILNWYITR